MLLLGILVWFASEVVIFAEVYRMHISTPTLKEVDEVPGVGPDDRRYITHWTYEYEGVELTMSERRDAVGYDIVSSVTITGGDLGDCGRLGFHPTKYVPSKKPAVRWHKLWNSKTGAYCFESGEVRNWYLHFEGVEEPLNFLGKIQKAGVQVRIDAP